MKIYSLPLLLFLIFIIIININFNIVNGQGYQLYDVTNDTSEYNKYPIESTSNICKFEFYILVINNFDSSGPPQSLNSTGIIGSSTITELVKDSTSILFKVSKYRMDYGLNYIDRFSVSGDSSGNSVTIQYSCEVINFSLLSIQVLNDNKLFYSSFTQFFSQIKINGLKYKTQLITNDQNISIKSLTDDYYIVEYNLDYYNTIGSKTSNWTTNISFIDDNNNYNDLIFSIQYKPDYNNLLNEIFDIESYPSNNNEIIGAYSKIGYSTSALVTFRSISQVHNPIYFSISNNVGSGGSLFYSIPKPISGSYNNLTYISICYNSDTSKPSQFKLISQNNKSPNYQLINNLNLNITENEFSGMLNGLNGGVSTDPSYDNDNGIPLFSIYIAGCKNYTFKTFFYSFGIYAESNFNYPYPFGFKSGSFSEFYLGASIPTSLISTFDQIEFVVSDLVNKIPTLLATPQYQLATSLPTISLFNKIYIGQFKFLLQFQFVSIESPFKKLDIIINNIIYKTLTSTNLVSGNLNTGSLEIILDSTHYFNLEFSSFVLYSENSARSEYSLPYRNSLIDSNQILELPTIKTNNFNYLNIIKNITFLYNVVDTSNQIISNKMYLELNELFNDSIALRLIDPKTLDGNSLNQIDNIIEQSYFAKWDSSKRWYEINFFVPANTIPGYLDFYLLFDSGSTRIYSKTLPKNFQLDLITKSIDIRGPVFKNIIKQQFSTTKVGFRLTIEDDVNGFDHGLITIMGSIDGSTYNFTLSQNSKISGDKWLGEYDVIIDHDPSAPCISQEFVITYVELWDTFSNNINFVIQFNPALTNIDSSYLNHDSSKNPFIYYLNDSSINRVSFTCSNIIDDPSPPGLVNFTASKSIIDVGGTDRWVTFNFEAEDPDSGMKDNVFPKVYLIDTSFTVLECVSKIKSISFQNKNAQYNCSIELPIGYGSGNGALISVYGLTNNGGTFTGFTSQDLFSTSFISSLETTTTSVLPIITGTSQVSNLGGDDLWIYGIGFDIPSMVLTSYDGGDFISIPPNEIYPSAILLKNIKATNNSIQIAVQVSTGSESNRFDVQPIIFTFVYIPPASTESPEPPTESPEPPTESPQPTTKPQKCIGSPECGGEKQGYCSNSGKCICFSPWVGPSCTSQIIIINPPIINTTDPTTEINIPGDETSGNLFKSLISLVSLRELDYNGNQVKVFPFSKWIYSKINSNTSLYETSISTNNETLATTSTTTTNITVTLVWFSEEKTIEFANQSLVMMASSIKYTIEINNYPFSSKLNQLQLVMSAIIESTKTNDICSSKQFGDNDSSDDDSNFLRISVDDYSVYGRFIKRAILDSKVIGIKNEKLDSSMVTTSNSYSSQSFIGITIPHYDDNVTIDPDFSVLLDTHNSNKNSENLICSKKSNRLSGSKIAGIVIGGVAFLTCIAIAIWWSIKKSKSNKKFIKAVNLKLQGMNNN